MFKRITRITSRLTRATALRALTAAIVMTLAGRALGENSAVGTTFTYQGQLTEAGEPVTGPVDLVFRLFGVESGGSPLPEGVIVADDYEIGDDGRFTIDLNFGDLFNGEPRWLEIEVNGETLSPRQPIMAVPHAMVATTAANVPTKAVFGTYNGITGVGTLETLNVSGNVGIGTTIPQDNLHVFGDGATLRLQDDDNPNSYTAFTDVWSGGAQLTKRSASGVALLDIDAAPQDGTGDSWIRFFTSQTNTTGSKQVRFLKGDGTLFPSAVISVDGGNSYFQNHGGNFGIGLTDPQYPLHVEGRIFASTSGWAVRGLKTGVGTFPGVWGESESTSNGASGVRGYISSTTPGDNSAGVYGRNFSTNGNGMGVRGIHDGDGVGVYGATSGSGGTGVRGVGGTIGVQGVAADSNAYGGSFSGDGSFGSGNALIVWGESHMLNPVGIGTTDPQDQLHVVGTTRTDVLRIMGGSDLSERFDITVTKNVTPQPGMVVCIDPENPGKLIPSSRAYDRTVAGVISGAGGVKTGMLMGQDGSEADGAHAVALTGRVYVFVDASDDAVVPGDLLTTSNVPGHAMKVTDYDRAHGTIIGKAMSSLDEGERGLVLVLVNLQ